MRLYASLINMIYLAIFFSIQGQQNKYIDRLQSSQVAKKKDDHLFEFLNSNNPPATVKGHVRNSSGPKTSTPLKTKVIEEKTPTVYLPVEKETRKEQVKQIGIQQTIPIISNQIWTRKRRF